MLFVNHNTLYVRNASTRQWLQVKAYGDFKTNKGEEKKEEEKAPEL